MIFSGDYSIAIWAQTKLKSCEEIKRLQGQRVRGLSEWLKSADFKIQFISSINRFFLVTKSEFVLPNSHNPILREELALNAGDGTLVFSVFLRPAKNELHLILSLSKIRVTTPNEECVLRIICDYILPVGVVNSRSAHILRLRRDGWTCKNHISEEKRDIFGEIFQTRPVFEDKKDNIIITTLIK